MRRRLAWPRRPAHPAPEAAARPLLLGHRGHRRPAWGERENTLPAFDHALRLGCDGVELDLHLSADGRIVVHHDAELSVPRPGGGRPHKEPLAATSLRTLRRLQPELATLDDVLRRYRHSAWMDLEIKSAAVAPALPALLQRWPLERGYVVSSFDPAALAPLAQANAAGAGIPLCLNLRRPCSRRRLQLLRRSLGLTWVAPHVSGCTGWYLRRLLRADWQVLVWTVNRPAKMRMLARAGVQAICSDDPEVLVEVLGPGAPGPPAGPPPA